MEVLHTLRRMVILYFAQQKIDLPPPSSGDWAFTGAWFFLCALLVTILIAKTNGFRRIYAALPFLRKIGVPPFEERKWNYYLIPGIFFVLAAVFLFAAVATR